MSQGDLRGKFVWHELMTPDAHAAADFYARVLPWTTEASTVPGYTLWMSGAAGVAGLMDQPQAVRDSGAPPSWLVYIATPDVDATVEAAQRLGGKLLKSPTDIPGIGRFAVLSDPQGAAFAVFTPDMAGMDGARPLGRFSWHELATIDPQSALAFYAQLFGWTRGRAHDMGAGGLYQIIEHAGAQIGGVYVLQNPSKPPHWLSYVRVERLDEALAAVRAHGGRVLREPQVVPGGDRVAHIMDPQGGIIALDEPPAPVPTMAPPPPAAPRRPTPRRKVKRAPAKAKPAAKRSAAKVKRAAKGAAKRRAKRVAKRVAKRPAKRAAKRPAKRAAKRPAKRVAKRPAKRVAKRPAKRVAKRVAKKAARRTSRRAARRR